MDSSSQILPLKRLSVTLLTIIIPVYNEEHRLARALEQLLSWQKTALFPIEILVVENGSRDKTTEIANQYAIKYPFIRVLHSCKGKGAAVREGMLNGKGDCFFVCDCDLSMPIVELSKFMAPQFEQYDILVGSREAPGSLRLNEPFYRHIMGRVFNFVIRVLLIPDYRDTQCGFKLFKKHTVQAIFSQLTIMGWTFDVEALYIALSLGYRIAEVPITWYFNNDSKVKPIQDTWHMLLDILKIRFNARKGFYEKNPPLIQQDTVTDCK